MHAASTTSTPAEHGSLHYFLLPYIEELGIYNSTTGYSYTSTAVVKTYIAPLDPSLTGNMTALNSKGVMAGLCCYEANGYIFTGDVGALEFYLTGTGPNGDTADGLSNVYPTIPNSVSDGTSNTLLFAERYAYNCLYSAGVYGNRTWGEDGAGPSQWAPFLIHYSVFDVAPHVGSQSCYTPQAFTHSGCQIGLVDGSVRMVAPSISATTWAQRVSSQRRASSGGGLVMNILSLKQVAGGLLILLLLTAGCGPKGRPRVHGKVTCNGQAVGNQTLTLVSEAEPPDRFTHNIPLQPDGTFSGEAPVPGAYKVVISKSLAAMEGRPLAGEDAVKVPEKYRSAATTDLTWTIQPGENTREFVLAD